MEEEHIEKLDNTIKMIEILEEKNSIYKSRIIKNIEYLENQLEQASINLTQIEKKNQNEKENINLQNEIQKIIKKLTTNLLEHKPLTNIEQSNKKIYKYISKLGKKIEKLKTFPDNSIKINNQNFDHKALKEAIADFILFYSIHNVPDEIINSKNMCEELGLIQKYKIDKKIDKLKIIKKIENDLDNQNINSLFFWVQKNYDYLKKLKSRLLFLTFKIYILKQLEKLKDQFCLQDILNESRILLLGIYEINPKPIQSFLSSLIINEKNFENYYKKKQKNDFQKILINRYKNEHKINWENIKTEFLKNIYKIFEISPKDPLFEIFKAGLYTYPKFIKMKEFIKNDYTNNEHIDFAIDLPNEFNYHNLIVCPVSKDICTIDNPPVLLNCGHVISDSSAKKLAKLNHDNTNNSFKCPVCPAKQFYSEVHQLNIN